MYTFNSKGEREMTIIENKNLKTSSNRRRIDVGVNCPLEDGLVAIIPQEEFEEYRRKYQTFKNENGELVDKEKFDDLHNQLLQAQDEKLLLEEKLQSKEKEIEELTNKLNEEKSKDIVKDITSVYEGRISDLKEDVSKKEKEAQLNMDKVDLLRQQKENELNSLRKEKDDEIDSLRKDKDSEIAILREKVNKVEKDKGNLETTFGMLLKDYKNLSDKTLVKLFYRKNDDIKHYEEFLNSKSLQRKETYALPMEKEE